MRRAVMFLTAAVLILTGAAALFLNASGPVRTDVYVREFTASGDADAVTVRVDVVGSMGYVYRDAEISRDGSALLVKFHAPMGGLNSRLGASDTFTFPVTDCDRIYFYRGDGDYVRVLERDAAGPWRTVRG